MALVEGEYRRGVQIDISKVAKDERILNELKLVESVCRVTNYIAAAQLYLKDNFLLSEPLQVAHIKDRLIGHWGTCPGINLIYVHASLLIRKHDIDMLLVVGPGHGAPAVLANLFLENSLARFYPHLERDLNGLANLIRGFAWPGGFPSHLSAQFPGSIHEGGELGYALATAFGSILDSPDRIATCIIGDGEAETGPTAASWHSYKFIDARKDGAVLPILHLNNYKISSQTIFGAMSNDELVSLFEGYGWQVRIIDGTENIHVNMHASMEWAYSVIRENQRIARQGAPGGESRECNLRWPLLILKTPKGWTGVSNKNGKQIEGTWRSHGIPLADAKRNPMSLAKLEEWLRRYNITEFINPENGRISEDILFVYPTNKRQLGFNRATLPDYIPLNTPALQGILEPRQARACISPCEVAGRYLYEVMRRNLQTFRIFSPDELSSNKLTSVLKTTSRAFYWGTRESLSQSSEPSPTLFDSEHGGRVMEVLSEHLCQGWLQGYTLTGRHGIFPSYEAFLGIVITMIIQWAKFKKISLEVPWRTSTPSLNYIATSTLWRQEHNGYSHQDPVLINALVNLKSYMVGIYFPPDANTFCCTLDLALRSKDRVNVIIGTKAEVPLLFSPEDAYLHVQTGAGILKEFSTDEGVDPDVVLVGCGCEITTEVIMAAKLLMRDCPQLRVRVVNVVDILALDASRPSNPRRLSEAMFEALFTKDKPVIFAFHGYPSVIRECLYHRPNPHRVEVFGYHEEGTTTTPFDMLVVNGVSRFHVAIAALECASPTNKAAALTAPTLVASYKCALKQFKENIQNHGHDPEWVTREGPSLSTLLQEEHY